MADNGQNGEGEGPGAEADEICRKRRTKEYEAVPNPKRTTSTAWNVFHVIQVTATKKPTGMAQCTLCQKPYKAFTSTLNRHINTNHKQSRKRPSLPADQEVKRKLVQKCVDYVTTDKAPVQCLAKEGLLDLLQEAVDVGAAHRH